MAEKRNPMVQLLVVMNKMSVTPVTVSQWEGLILRTRYEIESEREPPKEWTIADAPDARAEYARLAQAHGNDRETGRPWVEVVFGASPIGIKNLKDEIAAVMAGKKGPIAKAIADADADIDDDDEADAELEKLTAPTPAGKK